MLSSLDAVLEAAASAPSRNAPTFQPRAKPRPNAAKSQNPKPKPKKPVAPAPKAAAKPLPEPSPPTFSLDEENGDVFRSPQNNDFNYGFNDDYFGGAGAGADGPQADFQTETTLEVEVGRITAEKDSEFGLESNFDVPDGPEPAEDPLAHVQLSESVLEDPAAASGASQPVVQSATQKSAAPKRPLPSSVNNQSNSSQRQRFSIPVASMPLPSVSNELSLSHADLPDTSQPASLILTAGTNIDASQAPKPPKVPHRSRRGRRSPLPPEMMTKDPSEMLLRDLIHRGFVIDSENDKKAEREGKPASAPAPPPSQAENNARVSLAPQVRIVDGQLVIDNVEAAADSSARDNTSLYRRVDSENERGLNSRSYSRWGTADRWTKEDTKLFYTGLRQFGMDFAMISQLFPGRTRRQVKSKFMKEDRLSKGLVDLALKQRSTDHSHYDVIAAALKKEKESSNPTTVECIPTQQSTVEGEATITQPAAAKLLPRRQPGGSMPQEGEAPSMVQEGEVHVSGFEFEGTDVGFDQEGDRDAAQCNEVDASNGGEEDEQAEDDPLGQYASYGYSLFD